VRDERLFLGLVLFHVLAAAPGALMLYALGLVRPRPVALAAAAGPAFLVGVVLVGVPLVVLVVVGVAVNTLTSLAALALAMLVAGVVAIVAGRGRGEALEPAPAAPTRIEVIVERVVLAGIGVFLVVGSRAFTNLPTLWDDANIWSLKGLALFHHEGLVDGIGRNPQLSTVHLDYPILQPLTEATFFRAIGGVDLRLWHFELWLLFAAVIWTLAWLLGPLGRSWPWTVVLGTLALSGIFAGNIVLGDADTLMAGFIGCATASYGIWLERGHRAHAVLGALLLAGAANVKNEGLVFGVALGVALVLAAAIGRRPGRWRDLAASAGIVLVAVLPWQLWVLGNEAATRATKSPWQVLGDLGFLLDRLDFLRRGVEQIVEQLMNTGEWSLLAPAFLVTAAVLIVFGRQRTVACFYLAAATLGFASVAYVYWVTPLTDLGGFEQRTGPRIVLGIVFMAGAGLAHLLQVAASARADPVPPPGEAQDLGTRGSAATEARSASSS
jgi:hypothetical protein